jgi:hypothetical protein
MSGALRKGDRIRLVAMPNDPYPIQAGETGTVTSIVDHGTWTQVGVAWDSGRMLMLTVPPDAFEVIAGAGNE